MAQGCLYVSLGNRFCISPRDNLALSIVAVGGDTECKGRCVTLVGLQDELGKLGGFSEAQG